MESAGPDPRRWLGLAVIAVSQLMIVLDATIVNVALPAMASDLRISEADRQWVVTAYTLAFGGLLLLGGRVADHLGRRTTFIVGLLGFAFASALGGAAGNVGTLLVARGLQGLFGALLAPAALALVTTMFTDPHERAKSFAIFGAVAGGGSAIGLVLGGMLTEYLSWRATMFVNIPIALLAFAGAVRLLPRDGARNRGRPDIVGAVLATVGLGCVVLAFSQAERKGWTATPTLVLLGVGLALLIMFVTSQRLAANPLLPLRVLADRTRAGANIAVLLGMVAMFGVFFFLSFYMQGVLGFEPVQAGVAFLPVTGGIIVSSAVVSAVTTRVAPRLLMGGGLFGSAGAMFLLARIEPDGRYATDLLPALVLIGLSLGCVFVPAFNAATVGVAPADAGVASAAVNTAQQVGGSLGIAFLSTVAGGQAAEYLVGRQIDAQTLIAAQVAGYARASLWAGLICVVAGVVTLLMVDVERLELSGFGESMPAPAGPVADPGAVTAPVLVVPPPVPWSEPTFAEPEPADVVPEPEMTEPEMTEPVEVQPMEVRPVEKAEDPGSAELSENDSPSMMTFEPAPASVDGVPEPLHDAVPAARSAVESSSGSDPWPPIDLAGLDGLNGSAASVPAGLAVRGHVRKGSGLGVAGAALTLLNSAGVQVARGTSGADGAFEFGVPDSGEFVLVARKAGHRPHALTVWVNVGSADVELVLFGAASLVGTVVASWKRLPVRGALVTLADPGGDVVASVRTDANGEYEIPEITSGTFTLVVTTPSYRPTAQLVEIVGDGRTRQDIEVAGAATLTGIARTPEGRVIVDARVILADADGRVIAETFTGEDGRYQFTELVEGGYTITAIGYPAATDGVVLGPGQAGAHEITLGHSVTARQETSRIVNG